MYDPWIVFALSFSVQINWGNYFKRYTNIADDSNVVLKQKSYFEKLKDLLESTPKQ